MKFKKIDFLLKSVIEIDEVEYIIDDKTINALELGLELIPIKRIIDSEVVYIARYRFVDMKIIDKL